MKSYRNRGITVNYMISHPREACESEKVFGCVQFIMEGSHWKNERGQIWSVLQGN